MQLKKKIVRKTIRLINIKEYAKTQVTQHKEKSKMEAAEHPIRLSDKNKRD